MGTSEFENERVFVRETRYDQSGEGKRGDDIFRTERICSMKLSCVCIGHRKKFFDEGVGTDDILAYNTFRYQGVSNQHVDTASRLDNLKEGILHHGPRHCNASKKRGQKYWYIIA